MSQHNIGESYMTASCVFRPPALANPDDPTAEPEEQPGLPSPCRFNRSHKNVRKPDGTAVVAYGELHIPAALVIPEGSSVELYGERYSILEVEDHYDLFGVDASRCITIGSE